MEKQLLIEFVKWLRSEYQIEEVYEMFADEFLQDRAKIIADQANVSGQVCSHPDKYFVSGVFGGYWCDKCDRNVDNDCEQTLC